MEKLDKFKIIQCIKCEEYFISNTNDKLCDDCQLKYYIKSIFTLLKLLFTLKLDKIIKWLGRRVNK